MKRTKNREELNLKNQKQQARMVREPAQVADKVDLPDYKDLSFRVAADWHHRFKTTASMHRVSMKQVLEEGFELWIAKKEKDGR